MEMSVGLSSSVKGLSLCPLAFSRFNPSPPSSTSKFLFRFSVFCFIHDLSAPTAAHKTILSSVFDPSLFWNVGASPDVFGLF
ncbi:hypothetical protein Gohar_008850 [Gossypium harknessii]|uniref:Uncharacterized protein n=1 Tax=Gossypium harknessii TaxID=34285 RepID=A0A7J9GKZ0_9ROSI|nr:hypothetical protein [Gossypium harknessii]